MKNEAPLEIQLFYLIEKAHKSARRYADETFIEHGFDITIDQWLTLKKIYDDGPIAQNEIAQALFKDKASITRILEILIRKKLISKSSNEDRRVNAVNLTTQGRETVRQLLVPVNAMRKKAVGGLADKEVSALKKALDKIISNLE